MKNYIVLPFIIFSMFLSGCETVPMAHNNADEQAKEFVVAENKANIYLYQKEPYSSALGIKVALNDKPAGKLAADTYYKWSVAPGEHEIASLTRNSVLLTIDAQPGQNYFVEQQIDTGVWVSRSRLNEVDEKIGKKAILSSRLISDE